MNRQAITLGLVSIFFAAAVPSMAVPPAVLKGESYDQARARIIKRGYRPVRFMRTEDGCLLDKICKRYPELINCWVSKPARCEFAFVDAKGREYLLVITSAQPRRVKSIETPSPRERKSWPQIQR